MILLHYQIWSLIFFDTHYRNTSGVILTERFHLNFMFVLSGPHILIVDEVFQEALNILLCWKIVLLCPRKSLNLEAKMSPKCPRNSLEKIVATLVLLYRKDNVAIQNQKHDLNSLGATSLLHFDYWSDSFNFRATEAHVEVIMSATTPNFLPSLPCWIQQLILI